MQPLPQQQDPIVWFILSDSSSEVFFPYTHLKRTQILRVLQVGNGNNKQVLKQLLLLYIGLLVSNNFYVSFFVSFEEKADESSSILDEFLSAGILDYLCTIFSAEQDPAILVRYPFTELDLYLLFFWFPSHIHSETCVPINSSHYWGW